MAQEYASNFNLTEVTITSADGSKTEIITDLVQRIDYFESIKLPSVVGEMTIADNAKNIIASLPIQGLETVSIKLQTTDERDFEYNFRVYKISRRFATDRFQTYSLGLIRTVVLVNETQKVSERLEGTPDEIVNKLLEDYLNVSGIEGDSVEKCCNKIKFFPGKRTPFAIIDQLTKMSIPQSQQKNVKGNNKANSSTNQITGQKTTTNKLKGTAGYFFFENYEGYHFKSIDWFNDSAKNESKMTFIQENVEIGDTDTRKKILDIDFLKEIDMLDKLRKGAFSGVVAFYNISTGSYDEFQYHTKDAFKEMKHLGDQDGVPTGQAQLAESPTRVYSVLLDHEVWNSGKEISSPEKRDGATTRASATNEITVDQQKHYVVQTMARQHSLNNQKVKITVPIEPSLQVGHVIEILIPNMIPASAKDEGEGSEVYDPEHSGLYLISEINHAYDSKAAKGNTHITMIRDTYGRKGYGSKSTTVGE